MASRYEWVLYHQLTALLLVVVCSTVSKIKKNKKNGASLHMGPQTRRRPKIKQHPEFMFVTPFLPRHLHYCQPLGDRNTVECCTRKDPSALRV